MGWEIRTPSAWPWSVQEIEQSFTRAARDDHSATRGSQDRHQTKRSTVGPKRRKLSDQLSEKAERSAVGSHLRGKPRPDKPWLDGLPRIIFLGDMGDVLSCDVPIDYLRDEVFGAIASTPGSRHVWMLLTKQPKRLTEFARW